MPKSYVLLGVVAVVAFLLGYLVGVQKPTPTVAQTATAASIAPTTTTTQLTTPTAAATPKKIVIVDSAGRYVEITKPVTKVATLDSPIIIALAVLNATEYLVGVPNSALQPQYEYYYIFKHYGLGNVKNVGDFANPNYEVLAELRPQIVFDRLGYALELEEKLEPMGIKVVRIDPFTPSGIVQNIKLLGLIFDREREAENYAKWVDKVMSIVNERLKGLKEEEKLTVYPEFFYPWTSIGRGTGVFDVPVLAGLKPITSEFAEALPRVSPEWVIQRNPDVIFKYQLIGLNTTLSSFEKQYKEVASRLSTTKAVKNGKVIILPTLLGSGVGYPVGVLYIAKVAYPDRFRDVDPNQYLCEFLQMIHLPCKGVWGYAGPNNPVLGWT